MENHQDEILFLQDFALCFLSGFINCNSLYRIQTKENLLSIDFFCNSNNIEQFSQLFKIFG